jgi:hypothetical protein
MLASILIIIFSVVLFAYWFRYCCTLLLRNAREAQAGTAPATDNRFGVASVVERLRTEEELDPLHDALDREYQVFKYLVEHAAGLELASLEDRLLLLDYKLMQLWYRMTLTAAPRQAREALSQMASILDVLVQKMSRQAGTHVEA